MSVVQSHRQVVAAGTASGEVCPRFEPCLRRCLAEGGFADLARSEVDGEGGASASSEESSSEDNEAERDGGLDADGGGGAVARVSRFVNSVVPSCF